jgi:cytochrome c-type biogenesis protein
MAASTLSIGLAVLGGFVTVLSPCILPILPILLGRSLQSHRLGPVALVAGLVSGFAVAGSLLGVTASWLTGLANVLRQVAIALLLFLGLLAIFPTWSYRFFSYFSIKSTQESLRIGLWGEFWLGTQLGLLWTPCAGPILGGILVLAAVKHQVAFSFVLLVAYGVGAALPLLAIAYGGRAISRRLLQLRSHSQILQRVGGVIIMATAIAIILGWDVQLQLWLAPIFPSLPL